MRTMADLIDEALAAVAAEPDCDPASFWSLQDWGDVDHVPAVAVRLYLALQQTGPLFYEGIVYQDAIGETYRRGIDVIEGVRMADQVPIPEQCPASDTQP